MGKPLLILVHGLPGAGKTTLARQLAADTGLPVFSRDGIFETLYDAFECRGSEPPPLMASAALAMLYYAAGRVLAAGQPVIVEAFFGRPEMWSAQLLHLRRAHDFEPFQIVCKADGHVLLERFLRRAGSDERHASHRDLEWLEYNRERLVRGELTALPLGGQLVEVDTTTPYSFDYANLLRRVRAVL